MSNFDYQNISKELLSVLTSRQREIIARRFGLAKKERETLEAIGQDYDLTRERVRQIQDHCLSKIRNQIGDFGEVFNYLREQFANWGNLRREDKAIGDLGGEKFKNQILFLLTLDHPFERKRENQEFYTLWLKENSALSSARKTINLLERFLEKEKQLFAFEELFDVAKKRIFTSQSFQEKAFLSFIEATKKIEESPTGLFGLSHWPEVKPRGARDRAYLVLKGENNPLHFQKITDLINKNFQAVSKEALCQTVHNELIKDPRFVLVGRGIYALKEWGFEDGTVKDIILKTLQKKKKPLTKEEILEEVLRQRFVQPNTVLLALGDKNYFQKTRQGKYILAKS